MVWNIILRLQIKNERGIYASAGVLLPIILIYAVRVTFLLNLNALIVFSHKLLRIKY